MDLNPSHQITLSDIQNILRSEELSSNDLHLISKIYHHLSNQNSALKKEILQEVIQTLHTNCNQGNSLYSGLKILEILTKNNNEFSQEILSTLSSVIPNIRDPFALKIINNIFVELLCVTPSLSKNIFKPWSNALTNIHHTPISLQDSFKTLGSFIQRQKNLIPYAIKMLNLAINHPQNDAYSFETLYSTLNLLIEKNVIPLSEALDLIKKSIHKKENNPDSLYATHAVLMKIIDKDKRYAPDVLKIFKKSLLHPKNKAWVIKSTYDNIESLLKLNISFTPFVLDAIITGFKHNENNDSSYATAYNILESIIQNNPLLAPCVLKTIQSTPVKSRHDCWALKAYYSLLESIANATPSLIPQAFNLIKKTLSHEHNNEFSLASAYTALSSIVQKKQEYGSEIIDIILSSNPDLEDKNQHHHAHRLYLILKCIKNKENLEKIPYFQQHFIKKAQKYLSFSSIPEISYIQKYNFPFSLVKDQQRVKTEIIRRVKKENTPLEIELIRKASFNIARIFGRDCESFFDKMQRYLPLYDALRWIPYIPEKKNALSFKKFLLEKVIYRSDKDKVNKCRNLKDLEFIAQNWENFSQQEQTSKFSELLALACKQNYPNYQYDVFATEAALNNICPKSYKEYENIYAASLDVPELFDSNQIFQHKEFQGQFLPRNDPRVAFFGNATSCCQHLEGSGKVCTVSTMIDPFSQLFVVTNKKGEIIAGSWVWENIESGYRNVCFDSIEIHISLRENKEKINDIYEIYKQAGNFLVKKEKCKTVSVGNAPNFDLEGEITHIPLPLNYHNKYSDSQVQTLLSENKYANPFQYEDPFFIRKACEEDEHLGTYFNTFVFFDRSGDSLGYCTYDNNVAYLHFELSTQVPQLLMKKILNYLVKNIQSDDGIHIMSKNSSIHKTEYLNSDFIIHNQKEVSLPSSDTLYKITVKPIPKNYSDKKKNPYLKNNDGRE